MKIGHLEAAIVLEAAIRASGLARAQLEQEEAELRQQLDRVIIAREHLERLTELTAVAVLALDTHQAAFKRDRWTSDAGAC